MTILQKNSNVVWMPNLLEEKAGNLPAPQVNRPYYRSQAFKATVAINPLVAAAYPLLTLATRFCNVQKYGDLSHLYQMLLHEMRVFESQASHQGYRESIITIASYLLCVLLDETIIQSNWGKGWQQSSLLAVFHHEDLSQEHVYQIINRLLQRPAHYLELLELTYLCLSLGLKNSHQHSTSPEFLEKLDKVYCCIREERGEVSQGFLVQAQPPLNTKVRKRRLAFSLPLTLLFSMSLVVVFYGAFSYTLKAASAPLIQQISTLI